MSVFNEFDQLRNTVNRLMSDFDMGLRGGGGRRHGRGRRGGGGLDMMDEGWSGFPMGMGGWDEDILDLPMLTAAMGGQPLGGGQQIGKAGDISETKMEDVGQQPQFSGKQATQLTQKPEAGTLQPTFKPQQIMRARVNVEDAGDKFIVTAELPGFDKQNIKVNVDDNNVLSIKGEQTAEWVDQAKDKKYLRAERSFANIQRNLHLPKGVDPAKITANYENGVLHVNLPKTQEAEKQKQDIQIK